MIRFISIVAAMACACVATVMATASTLEVGAPATPNARDTIARQAAPCVTRAQKTVTLAESASVNRIEVALRAGTPEHGTANVRVRAGRAGGESSERIIRVVGTGSRALEFSPALAGTSFEVTIEPAAAAASPDGHLATSACVDQVTLMHKDARVITLKP